MINYFKEINFLEEFMPIHKNYNLVKDYSKLLAAYDIWKYDDEEPIIDFDMDKFIPRIKIMEKQILELNKEELQSFMEYLIN